MGIEAKREAKHAGDCTIYASLHNGNPEDGICTCGLGLRMRRRCDYDYIYSQELDDKLRKENGLLAAIFGEVSDKSLTT